MTAPTEPADTDIKRTFIWLDLKTTGLDPVGGRILEFAAIATDVDGQGRFDTNEFGGNAIERVLRHDRAEVIGLMDDYVLNMHLSSELLKRVWRPGRSDEWAQVQNDRSWTQLASFIRRQSGAPQNTYLAGNSIHLDRAWLAEHRPEIVDLVSRRMFDVSSFLLARPDLRGDGRPAAHRAMADALSSLGTYTREIYPRIRRVPLQHLTNGEIDHEIDLNEPTTRDHNLSDQHGG